MKKAIIVDIDGTISKMCDRGVYDFKKAIEDYVYEDIVDLVNRYRVDHKIIIVTGRSLDCYDVTREWLFKNNIEYSHLYMRLSDDRRPDSIVKEEIYNWRIKKNYKITLVLEDRDRVVRMWRDLGLRCLQVKDGNY